LYRLTEFSYTIKDEAGIHARPAGMLVKALSAFESDITVACGSKSASAKKLFALMGLAVKHGETITVTASGPDEAKAAETAKSFLEANL
jgi:phosphocarrier protein